MGGPQRRGGSRGYFVTLEGGEGTGKSTLLEALAERAEATGVAVVRCREPGGTALGEQVREALLGAKAGYDLLTGREREVLKLIVEGLSNRGIADELCISVTTVASHKARIMTKLNARSRTDLIRSAIEEPPDPRAELLLFAAARAQLVAEVIRPALASGALVLCDRYADSTVAYQCYGRELPRSIVDGANAAATAGLTPDLTLLLDLPVEEGLRRAGGGGDYIELEAVEFHERVRAGYLQEARAAPGRWLVLDARQGPAALAAAAWERVEKLLEG